MTNFTPIASLAGGVLIGASASLLLLLNGQVAGISGILGGLLPPRTGARSGRAAFLAGLLLAGGIAGLASPAALGAAFEPSFVFMAIAGLLVGLGTELGKGCTSGHGVCGISRGSVRSVFATLTFMATGAGTVYVVRHVLGGRA